MSVYVFASESHPDAFAYIHTQELTYPNTSFFMNDKIVLITGASSGIGRAMAFAFGREGAKLAICARSFKALPRPAQQLVEHLRKAARG